MTIGMIPSLSIYAITEEMKNTRVLVFPLMAALTLLLHLLSLNIALLITSAASQSISPITPGSSLSPATPSSSYWLSPSGLYAFGFYPRGSGYSLGIFMAGIPQKTVVWTANRDDPPVPSNSTLSFTVNDGMLILQSTQSKTIAAPSGPTVSASMLDSGNFVLNDPEGYVTWQSFDYPTDTILEGQSLLSGKELFSAASEADPSTGIFRIKMQNDGNLVMYPSNTPDGSYAYWAPNFLGNVDKKTLNLANDGLLYVMNDTGQNLYNITNPGSPVSNIVYRARLDSDGILRLYSYNMTQKGNWSIVWSSTNDKCDPIGLCGFNSFCVINDLVSGCKCLPGFDFAHEGNDTSGCVMSFTAASCSKADVVASNYSISVEPNFSVEDKPYLLMKDQAENECQEACLQDCKCGAAIYSAEDGSCKKQRLPIRYARRKLTTSDSLFVKVGEIISTTRGDKKRPEEGRKGTVHLDVLGVSVPLTVIAVVVIIVGVILLYRNRIWLHKTIPTDGTGGMIDDVAPRSFTYGELTKMTQDFREEIGRGAFGTVYKGTTSNGRVLAVKKLEGLSSDGEREFQTEMKIIGRTHHRNLVRLLGYSLDTSNRLLVYDYMSNGSLANLLFSPKKLLSWGEKMGIVRNIAQGLLYLHEECETQIIHCDIKPGNILIDEYHCAKIADFGLSKLLKSDQTNTFTKIRGTRGYVAPEWHRNLPITTKVDVYSFGVVLLEIICTRRNLDQSLPEEQIILEHWVYDCFQAGDLQRLVSEDGGVDMRQLEGMVKVSIWCTLEEPSLRPSMRKVLLMLEGTIDIPSPPSPSSFISCI